MVEKQRIIMVWRPSPAEQKPPHHPRCQKPDCSHPPPEGFKKDLEKLVKAKTAPTNSFPRIPIKVTTSSRIDRLTYSNKADERWFAANQHKINSLS